MKGDLRVEGVGQTVARPGQVTDLVEIEVKCRHWTCGAQYSQTLEARPVGCYFPPVRCGVCGQFSLTILLIKINQEPSP